MSDHEEFEPIPGLPGVPPPGEHILWQGQPDWKRLAHRAFHVRLVGLYFAVLMLWEFASRTHDGAGAAEALLAAGSLVLPAALAIGILSLLAFFSARCATYTITNRRVVMKVGVALPVTVNFPFEVIQNAALVQRKNDFGDIELALDSASKVSFALLWPHSAPWRLARVRPMLRCIPEVSRVGEILGHGLRAGVTRRGDIGAEGSMHVGEGSYA